MNVMVQDEQNIFKFFICFKYMTPTDIDHVLIYRSESVADMVLFETEAEVLDVTLHMFTAKSTSTNHDSISLQKSKRCSKLLPFASKA